MPENRDRDTNLIVRLLKNIWRNIKITFPYFLLGVLLTALYQRYVPSRWIAGLFGANQGFGTLMAAALGVPLYTCGGGTIPLMAAGCVKIQNPGETDSVFPKHDPYGSGIGTKPGRVVWAYDPQSVEWDGTGYWWELGNFQESSIQRMVDDGIAGLAGAADTESGWNALFQSHNSDRGRDGSYQNGQKIAIKVNMKGAGAYGEETKGETRESYTNPVLLKTLLISLVTKAGVSPGDITVYDAGRIIPDYVQELCREDVLSGVQFRYRDLPGEHDARPDLNVPVIWSKFVRGEMNYLPSCVTEADYLINLANLKGHVYGITLTAKNHYGSIMNSNRMRAPEAAGVHRFLTQNRMETYTVLVDLKANYELGGKTMLYMLDGIICAPGESVPITGENSRWQQEPFLGDYTSSVFL